MNMTMAFLTVGAVVTLGFSPVFDFFLLKMFAGGDADDGPKVNDLDNDDASTDPNPEPLRGWDC